MFFNQKHQLLIYSKIYFIKGCKVMQIISIVNKKGGVGKTTTALAFAAGLTDRDFKVLAIDLDAQCNFTSTMNIQANKGSYDILAQQADINDVIVKADPFDVIPATNKLSTADNTITELGKEFRLREALQDLHTQYDYIIIDTPPNVGILSTNAMAVSDKIIIAVQADIYSADGLMQLYKAIEVIKKYCNNNLQIAGILLTRYNDRTILSKKIKAAFEEISQKIDTKLFNTFIRENISIKEAQAMKQSLFKYAKSSNGAMDYNNVIDEFLQDNKK